MNRNALIQSIPNFSEGRDLKKIEQIVDAFRAKPGVRLLDYSADPDQNRSVATVIGEPEALRGTMLEAIEKSVNLIDLTAHEGRHPRIGCVDVIPFIPLRGCTMQDADQLAKEIASEASERFGLPFYLYEKSAVKPYRQDISDIRRGQFEGLKEKMRDPMWAPDFGPCEPHPTGGATAIGARMPLIYFNVNLDTTNAEIARKIALRLRNSSGGLRYVKAMGITLEDRKLTQVTMNLSDYTKSSMYSAFEMVKMEARRYGVNVLGSEIAGYVPMQALIDCAEYYLQMDDFSINQVLEYDL